MTMSCAKFDFEDCFEGQKLIRERIYLNLDIKLIFMCNETIKL